MKSRILSTALISTSYQYLNFLNLNLDLKHASASEASEDPLEQYRALRPKSDEWCLQRGFDSPNLSCETCNLLEEATTLLSLQEKYNAKQHSAASAEATGATDNADSNADNNNVNNPPIDILSECKACCRSYIYNPALHPEDSLRGKYKYALLTYNSNSIDQHSEIRDFIERDLEDVLSFKGEQHFRAVHSENLGGMGGMDLETVRMMMGMGIMLPDGLDLGGLGVPRLLLFEERKKGGGSWSEEDEEEAEVIVLRGWKREDLKDMLITLLPNA